MLRVIVVDCRVLTLLFLKETLYNQLFVLVDGIYPPLSRFVKTFEEPVGATNVSFAKWQEGARKGIERAFGVLQRKFHILVRSFEYWFITDIQNISNTCLILHNMMVKERLDREETEDEAWYEIVVPAADNEEMERGVDDPLEDALDRAEAEVNRMAALQAAFYNGPAVFAINDNGMPN